MGLQLSVLLSFSIILLLSTIYGSSSTVHAQLTNSSSVAIPMTPSLNIVQIKQQQEQEQQSKSNNSSSSLSSSSSSPFIFASPSPNIRNSLPTMSTAASSSSFSGNYPSFQLPPIANAGHNQTVTAGSTVILNGSKSKSPNGIILGYSWKQIPIRSIDLGGVNSSVWEFNAPKVATNTLFRFQLNVIDNLGQTSSAFVNVLDKPALNIHTFPQSPSTQVKTPSNIVTTTPNEHAASINILANKGQNSVTIPTITHNKISRLVSPSPPLIPP
jgi:K319L-like, PKD domain